MRRDTSYALSAILVVLLLLSLFGQLRVFPASVDRIVAVFPEVEPLALPAVLWGVAAIACWQAVAVIGLRLISRARRHGFDASTTNGIRAMIGCLLVFVALVVSAFIALNVMGYTTPGVMYGLIGVGLVALIVVGALGLFLRTRPRSRSS